MNDKEQEYTVWLEAEQWKRGEWTPDDDSTDAIVTWKDGSRWGATFVAYQHIQTLTEKNKRTGACLSGAYLCVREMILVDQARRSLIEEVIQQLITSGGFTQGSRPLSREPH